MADCFNAGDITWAVIGTFVATLVLLGIIWFVYNKMKKRKVQKSGLADLVLVEEGAAGGKPKSYDNAGFVDDSMELKKSQQPEKNMGETKGQKGGEDGKKMPWGPFRFLFKSRNALDDSVMEEPQCYNVALKGHDFTGLGFNICGNMKDGIYVKDVMQRGPAAESKLIHPGDQIIGMTVSFKQIVLEDAVTLLSYASPYEVSLEMMRHHEKSLPHKGIFLSSSSHPSSSGQGNAPERVCHPFFKSQSIDDLRKVGKEHLDQQVSRVKKQANGTKHSSSTTMDLPTVVVVGSNESRSSSSHQKSPRSSVKSPNVNLPEGKPSQEANQKEMSVDEVDSPRGPIVPEIKVSAKMSKPEIIPRAKSKVTNLTKEAPDTKLVEAISPVVKMSAEFEEMVEEHAVSKQITTDVDMKGPKPAVIEVEPMEVNISQPSVQVEPMPSMIMMEGKGPHVEIEMGEEPVKKPERGKKDKKDKKDKDKQGAETEGEKPKGKFGFGINLPDLSLGFGKGGKAEDKEKGKEKTKEEVIEISETIETMEIVEESKKDKKVSKGKDKEKKKEMSPKGKSPESGTDTSENANDNIATSEPMPEGQGEKEKKPLEKAPSSGFGFSLKFPSFDLKRKESSGAEDDSKIETDPSAEKKGKTKKEKKEKEDSRPTSPSPKVSETTVTESTDIETMETSADAEKSPKKGGFHMPHIKLPKFGHSKHSYSFENPEGNGKEGRQSEIPKNVEDSFSSSVKVEKDEKSPKKVKKAMSEPEISFEGRSTSPSGVSYGLYPPSVESEIKEQEALALSRSRSPTPLGDRGRMAKSEEDLTKGGESKPGIVSKVIRDLKEKVSRKRSHSQEQPHMSSSEDEMDEAGNKKEKAKLDKKAAKEAKEKAAAEAKKEKERLKAEKKAKKAELKVKKQSDAHSSEPSSSSSDESDAEGKDKKGKKDKKRVKTKEKKSKEEKDKKKKATSPTPTPVETIEIETIEERVEMSQTQSKTEEKPVITPRKSKAKGESSEEKKATKPSKGEGKKDKESSSSSSSSSSSESDDEKKDSSKPKKPKRSAKRKAPIPPPTESSTTTVSETVSTSQVTVQMSENYPKTPEGKRSASVGDLSKIPTKSKIDNMDRAMSLDMTAEAEPSSSSSMPVASPLEDLSVDPDQPMVITHFGKGQQTSSHKVSVSSSSSAETLTGASTSVVQVHPKDSVIVSATTSEESTHPSGLTYGIKPPTLSQDAPPEMQKMVDETVSMMNTMAQKMESPSLVLSVPEKDKGESTVVVSGSPGEKTTKTSSSTVTVSSPQGLVMDEKEAEQLAQKTVDDILQEVSRSRMGDLSVSSSTSQNVTVEGPGMVSSTATTTSKNVSVTSIQSSSDDMEGDTHDDALQASESDPKPAASLLRGDSKTRLMQTVIDANTIKINPISPLRKDSSTSSSSVDSSPEVRTDSKPIFSNNKAPPEKTGAGQTIEITAQELDGIMMSHAEFLQRQAMISNEGGGPTMTLSVTLTPDSLETKDSSFDNWVFVEQKNAVSDLTPPHSHSDPEPSTSSSNDDDDIGENRNGAMSPSSYKTEYKFETSESHMTATPPPSGGSESPTTTVYSTTMMLPQKTVTQITLGEPRTDSEGRIVSKITLDSPTSTDTTIEADLPTLKPTK